MYEYMYPFNLLRVGSDAVPFKAFRRIDVIIWVT